MTELRRIGLGGGCHWCTEGIFVSIRGVERVDQGWIASQPPYDRPSEAVVVHYDPAVITTTELIAVHLQTHSATSAHDLRAKYRSAVYAFSAGEAATYREILGELSGEFAGELVTSVLPFVSFEFSLPEHRDYYRTDPDRPFCRRYIRPKLESLRADRPDLFLTLEQ